MYTQSLYSIEKLKPKYKQRIEKLNRTKSIQYGYNEEFDIVVISKTGQIDPDNIIELQGLKIGLPKPPKEVYSNDDQTWEVHEYPQALQKIKSIFEWNEKPLEFKENYIDYVEDCFKSRDNGYWFMNDGKKTYVTGSHYMFMTWSYIDIGLPDYRESNRLFWYFWEACKADYRSYGLCYLKNRRSGFSYMAAAEISNLATVTKNSRYGILSKSAPDAKLLFTDKVVRIVNNYPFFFKPIMAGSDKPKSEMVFDTPARKLTRNNMKASNLDDIDGLNTSIDFKATSDYAYDGEKLKLLVQDESGKWERPNNIITNHGVTRTCCRVGLDIIGKIMMGSTAGALDKGGEEFKDIYYGSDLREVKRNAIGQTPYGLYSFFIPMEWNFEGTFDKYGKSIFENPDKPILRYKGDADNPRHFITTGALSIWKAEYDGLRDNPDSQNRYVRQFPKYEKHAFRDEALNSLFNLTRIHDQLDYNLELDRDVQPVRGNFYWHNGQQDSRVLWEPNSNGRFRLSWIPKPEHTNLMRRDRGEKFPLNEDIGAFGCDPYNISQAKSRGSAGAIHGLTGYHNQAHMAPQNTFFLEYIARPPEADIFFEDHLMACIFYGMPTLIENNKSRILYYFKKRGYRGFSMNRPDVNPSQLRALDLEVGGIPMTGEAVRQLHAAKIESWINRFVGKNEYDEIGHNILLDRTLNDWARFDYDNRTKFDASISSGLAIMGVDRLQILPVVPRKSTSLNLSNTFIGKSNSRKTTNPWNSNRDEGLQQ